MNARETKNLPCKKTDVEESQWLMKLHTYGLLRNSFRPPQEIRRLRTYWRQRNDLVQSARRLHPAYTRLKEVPRRTEATPDHLGGYNFEQESQVSSRLSSKQTEIGCYSLFPGASVGRSM